MKAHPPAANDPPDAWPVPPALLLDTVPDGCLIVDRQARILMVNSQIEKLFGYSRAELVHQTIDMLVPERLRSKHIAGREAYLSQPARTLRVASLDLLALRKDGSEFPVELTLNPVETEQGLCVMTMVRDLTERQVLEDERRLLLVELEMERERQRIGMDLHDGIMQEIYGAGLTLEMALEDIKDRREADAADGVSRSIDQLHDVIRNIRSYIFDLRPRDFTGSLGDALQNLAREFGENSMIETVANVPSELPELEEDQSVGLYHITHEALSNIQKHARAEHVAISINVQDEVLHLEIKDDGRGFDTDISMPQQHRGMRNMSSRARALGGYLDVSSVPGKGTSVRIEMRLR
ncbi:MAG TPA: PAS domain-containing sensor histidine kinase [Dehalococcoidia bacterium]|nr:PAS domain-containing sensor histidine kinase [Dehalococcoidia bacterium]